jgi:hypothetical protein
MPPEYRLFPKPACSYRKAGFYNNQGPKNPNGIRAKRAAEKSA